MKRLLIVMALSCPLLSLAQKGKFTIRATRNTNAGETAYLYRYTIKMGKKGDTAHVANGGFTFSGSVDEVETGQIILRDGHSERGFIFYLEPGAILINYPADASHPVVSGTPLNRDWQDYRNMIDHLTDSINAGNPGKNITEFSKEIVGEKAMIVGKFVKKHPASPIGIDLLNQLAVQRQSPDTLEPIFNLLAASAKSSEKGKDFASRLKGMRAATVGAMAPLFNLPDTAGSSLTLVSFRGKYVLVDFWATWCAPCMAEMPNVAKAYGLYRSKGLEIIGVSLDRPDSKEKWLKTIREEHMDWKQVSDLKWWNSKAAVAYNINSVPANFLIDPQGKIIAQNLRGEALQKKLGELFQ